MTVRPNPPRLDDGYEDDLRYDGLHYPPTWVWLLILCLGALAGLTKSWGWW